MSTDQSSYPLDFSDRQHEWLDFDTMFQLPSEYLDSNPTSVESVSPRDLNQQFTDADFLDWDADPTTCSQAMFPDFVGYEAPVEELGNSAMDFQPFINPNDVLRQVPPIPKQFVDSIFKNTCPPDAQDPSLFRDSVESQAALDSRCYSQKEKRRDAAIALHLQRMQDELLSEMNTPSLSSNHISSPNWSEFSQDVTPFTAPSTSPVAESEISPPARPQSGPRPMQLVLDLNMNATTNVPKKQKPRSKAQRENYIKARKYGVCEKHRKQHKRCNCLEKAAAAHLNVNASQAIASTISLRANQERILVNKSPQRWIQSPNGSANTGLPRSVRQPVQASRPDQSLTQPMATAARDQHVVRQPFNVQKSSISSTPSVQFQSSPRSHDRAAAYTTSQLAPTGGLLNAPALYRHKDGLNKQVIRLKLGGEKPRQASRQSRDIKIWSGTRDTLDVQSSRAVDTTLTRWASTIVRQTLCQPRETESAFGRRGVLNPQNSTPICIVLVRHASATVLNAALGLLSHWQGSTMLSSAGRLLGRLVVPSSKLFTQCIKGPGIMI
ncbi:hypothetical protein BDW66DRAFT_147406 [Aspergillus desertorum]